VKHLTKAHAEGEITDEELDRHFSAYEGILRHFNSHRFRQRLNKIFKENRKDQ
jgi:hypothetical protein